MASGTSAGVGAASAGVGVASDEVDEDEDYDDMETTSIQTTPIKTTPTKTTPIKTTPIPTHYFMGIPGNDVDMVDDSKADVDNVTTPTQTHRDNDIDGSARMASGGVASGGVASGGVASGGVASGTNNMIASWVTADMGSGPDISATVSHVYETKEDKKYINIGNHHNSMVIEDDNQTDTCGNQVLINGRSEHPHDSRDSRGSRHDPMVTEDDIQTCGIQVLISEHT